jgi:hypothetical protein
MPAIAVCVIVALVLGGTVFALIRRNRVTKRNDS